MGQFTTSFIIAQVIVLFFGIGLHEYAHCKFAEMAGDPTPSYYGRVTLNLTKHFEMTGVIAMVLSTMTGFGLGWGKPAPMDPAKMRNPRADLFIAVVAGPLTNMLQAVIYALALRMLVAGGTPYSNPYVPETSFLMTLCGVGVVTNIGLALFNLIPFGPLDGHWLLGLLMPEKPRYYWYRFNRSVGFIGLIAVVFLLQTLHISLLSGPILNLFKLLTGREFFS